MSYWHNRDRILHDIIFLFNEVRTHHFAFLFFSQNINNPNKIVPFDPSKFVKQPTSVNEHIKAKSLIFEDFVQMLFLVIICPTCLEHL